jgi:hypothetical protein
MLQLKVEGVSLLRQFAVLLMQASEPKKRGSRCVILFCIRLGQLGAERQRSGPSVDARA